MRGSKTERHKYVEINNTREIGNVEILMMIMVIKQQNTESSIGTYKPH